MHTHPSRFLLLIRSSQHSTLDLTTDQQNMSSASTKSVAGIQEKDDARVIPMSRRADGSVRKERKVRPGYTPPEDVAKYTNRVLDSVRPAPSSPSPLATANNNTPKTKSQLKNEKRKAKRKEDTSDLTEGTEGTERVDLSSTSKSADEKQETAKALNEAAVEVSVVPAEASGPVDPEKKLRALNKKLRQAEQLKERQDKGEEMLPEQQEKISKMDELQAQIAELAL